LDRLTDLLTKPAGTWETTRDTGDAQRGLCLVSETRRNAGDVGDARRMAHNPEVAGSNPAPATKFAGQRPLLIMRGAFCACRVDGIVHEASEEGRRGGWGGEAYPADVVRDAGGGRTSTEARRRTSAMNCRLSAARLLWIHERADPGFRSPAGGPPGA